ncbi:G6PC3 phosphatase, partial [Piaya cayana]|nr:G6PC3 phosphatase [Piaya cayana]
MDALHAASARFAAVLQSGPPWLEKFWVTVTSVADPKSIFTVFFPLAYFLDHGMGVSVLWIGLLAEWLNIVLKWFLFGERLFWWVHESGLASTEPLALKLHQGRFRLDIRKNVLCFCFAGSPSGHCMITGAGLWPLVSTLTALASTHSRSSVVKLVPFTAYVLLLVTVGLSRIFVLAHFPHQVVGGILAGAVLGWRLQSLTPVARTPRFFVATALALLLGTLALHRLVIAANIDIDW